MWFGGHVDRDKHTGRRSDLLSHIKLKIMCVDKLAIENICSVVFPDLKNIKRQIKRNNSGHKSP